MPIEPFMRSRRDKGPGPSSSRTRRPPAIREDRHRGLADHGALITVDELQLLTLNISGPSLARADRLLRFFAELDVDVLVLTETRPMPGTEHVLKGFRECGYEVVSSSPVSRSERGVALIHRVAAAATIATPNVDLAHRLAIARLEADPALTVIGTYVPSRDATHEKVARKRLFLAQMEELLRDVKNHRELILVGDFNVVHRSHIPRYPSFRAWEYDFLECLGDYGLVDIFTELHPGVQAYSWIGRTGDGYRYDYAFVNEALGPHVAECEYLNQPREEGISDHAGVLMSLRACTEIRDVRLGVGRQASLTG